MSNKIQLRRGTTANRIAITPDSGEPCWDTDEEKLYIGDGVTAGGVVSGAATAHVHSGADITSGTVADTRLSANVPLKNAANVFTETQIMPKLAAGGASASTYNATFGQDLGDIGATAGNSTVVIGSTIGDSLLVLGQAFNKNLQFKWIYNATATSAVASLNSWGYANPLRIDFSDLSLQTISGGPVRIGKTTSTIGFFNVPPVAKPTALTTKNTGTLNTGDATSDTIINNMRTRINELETKLQSLGLLQ